MSFLSLDGARAYSCGSQVSPSPGTNMVAIAIYATLCEGSGDGRLGAEGHRHRVLVAKSWADDRSCSGGGPLTYTRYVRYQVIVHVLSHTTTGSGVHA